MSPLSNRRGSTLAIVLLATLLLSALALSQATRHHSSTQRVLAGIEVNKARYAARAEFERVCAEILLEEPDWTLIDLLYDLTGVNAEGLAAELDLDILGSLDPDAVDVEITIRGGGRECVFVFEAERDDDEIHLLGLQDHALEQGLGERTAT